MAKRMKSKIQPAVMKFVFKPDKSIDQASAGPGIVPGTGTYYVDLSQVASILNRRFYRQGLNWAVSGIKLKTTAVINGVEYPQAQSGAVRVSKLPNTWVMSNAWEKSFRAWQQMIKDATDDQGAESIKGKFLDYKIFADAKHHNLGSDANLLPIDNDENVASPGEWTMSDFAIPVTGGTVTDYELIAVGPNDPGAGASGKDAKSIIQGYADSRALPYVQDPNVPDDASLNWMAQVFNEGTQQTTAVIGMLEVAGDQAPYPYENDGTNTDTMYPGGETQLKALEIHSRELITGTTIGNTTYLEGGNFPCGLIKIEIDNYDGTYQMQPEITLTMVAGTHRGYLAEPMTEM